MATKNSIRKSYNRKRPKKRALSDENYIYEINAFYIYYRERMK